MCVCVVLYITRQRLLPFSWRSGVNVKTRKRNIVVPEDPGSFADAVVTVCQDAAEGVSLEADLEAAEKALNETELEYSRYGEILFQVFFAGGRLGTGAQLAAEDKQRLEKNVRFAMGARPRSRRSEGERVASASD